MLTTLKTMITSTPTPTRMMCKGHGFLVQGTDPQACHVYSQLPESESNRAGVK